MNAYNANVVIHVDEQLSDREIWNMEKELGNREGVFSACVNKNTPHLIVVDYDPRYTRSDQVLDYVKGNRLHAELIGGI